MLTVMTKRTNQTRSDLVAPGEASKIAGLAPATLAKMADRGQLSSSRPGGTHRRYLRSEIEALVSTTKVGAKS